MFRSVSSKVFPVVTQPGKSGTYAAQFVSARSKMTAYFRLIFSPPDPQPFHWSRFSSLFNANDAVMESYVACPGHLRAARHRPYTNWYFPGTGSGGTGRLSL